MCQYNNKNNKNSTPVVFSICAHRAPHRAPVAQLVEHRAVLREVAGSNPGRINTQDLKITEEKVLPL